MTTDGTIPLQQLKTTMRSQWMAGDFGMIAKTIAAPAEAFVDSLDLWTGARVLDVGCGTGNTAIPAARLGCAVTGVDIAPNLLMQARERAEAEHLQVTFNEGDAEDLPYADGSFDVIVSMFGAMFAPRPELVVQQFARVLRPGGLLAMANWNPESFSGAMFRTGAQHAPPPAGLPAPVQWGVPAVVRERLGSAFQEVQTDLVPIDFDLPESPAGVVRFFRQYFGPTHAAFARLDLVGQAALQADLEALWTGANVSSDAPERTLVRNEYLRVRAIRN